MENKAMENTSFSSNLTSSYDHVDLLPFLVPAIAIGAFICALNVFTVSIIIISTRLRRPANYPIVSVLLGAALQGLLTAPTYIFKRLDEKVHREYWLCDFYRLPYFLCGHILKISLMFVSMDRLVATRYPYRYPYMVTKVLVAIILLFSWFIVVLVDLLPFLPVGKLPDAEGCTYTPKKEWGITVISLFNVLPFAVIAFNYLIIWKIAVKITLKEFNLKESLNLSNINEVNGKDNLLTNPTLAPNTSEAISTARKSEASNQLKKGSSSYVCFCRHAENDEKCKYKKHLWDKNSSRKLRLAWELKATKTSLMLLIVYLLCWGPLGIMYMIDNYCLNCISRDANHASNRFIVKVISFASSLLLPLVYCWRTKEFRTETCRLTWKNRYRKKRSKEFRDNVLDGKS